MQVNVPLPIKYLGVDYAAGNQTITDSIALELILLGLAARVTPLPSGWDTGLAANLAAIGIFTRTLWASGALFWMPAGDGATNGLYFAGGGTGNFTLSAAMATGLTIPQGWVYLTANAGGLSNPAGWYYFTMSDDTNGKIYTTTYDSTSGVVPVIPSSPVEMAFTSAGRLTSTLADTQMFQVPANFAAAMGLNGLIKMWFRTFGNNGASNKFLSLRAGTNALYQNIPTTSPVQDSIIAVSACGSLSKQIVTRQSQAIGAANSATISNDFRAVNLAAESTLNLGIKLNALTDHFVISVRELSLTYGA